MYMFFDTLKDILKILGIALLGCSIIVGGLAGCAYTLDVDPSEQPTANEYEVVSVYQYLETDTNQFGGVINQEVAYCFTYIGKDGQLHKFDGFTHTEYGIWKLHIGKKNKYVTKGSEKHLYLTKETFNNLSKGD